MAQHGTVIGIDVGGTKIAVARYRVPGFTIEHTEVIDTPDGYDAVESLLIGTMQAVRTADTIAVGIGVPGLVDLDGSTIRTLPNIAGAEDKALGRAIAQATGLPTILGNDADLFTLAEAHDGAGKDASVVVGITLGTGVGGGIVINGQIFRGAHGAAAEIGHMLLMPGKPPYASHDMRGDVEQFLSGTALGKRCAEASDPSQYLQGATCSFLHPDIFREIAWMITSITHLIDPAVIVFGGSAGKALKPHLSAIHKELTTWMLPHAPTPKLAVASLSDAGTRGAALLAVSAF